MPLADRRHHVLGLRAYSELTSPDPDPRTDIVLGLALGQWAERILIDRIRDPIEWPDLSVVRVTCELKVHTAVLRFFEVVRLMIQLDDVLTSVDALHDLPEALAVGIRSVITSYDRQITEVGHAVLQELDPCLLAEVLVSTRASIVVVIA